jgi:hypothetical protein
MNESNETEGIESSPRDSETADTCTHEWNTIHSYHKVMTIPDCFGIVGRLIPWETRQCTKCGYTFSGPADNFRFHDLYGE